MIKEIPNPSDFRDHGVDYLNLAWASIIKLHTDFTQAEELRNTEEIEIRGDFWAAAERELGTALSLVEQGAEFLLKARISEISPWLLISRNPSDWPRKCDQDDINYAQFRTIDAQDLIKVHDTFSNSRLPEEFHQLFSSLRKQRNSIMHTVDLSLKITATHVIESIFLVSEYLIKPIQWVNLRRSFLEREKYSIISDHSLDYDIYQMAIEMDTALKLLTPTLAKRFLGFNKRQRCYRCPYCSSSEFSDHLDCTTAQLTPNTPQSHTLHCFACTRTFNVKRLQCSDPDCQGNVWSVEYGICLICGNNEEPH